MAAREQLKPLAGLTVVEHAAGVAAQYYGRLLAVMGATVIKVEPPGGIPMRAEPPLIGHDVPQSALYQYLNVNKLAVTCAIGHQLGRTNLRELLACADVMLDDTPVAGRAALGLDPESIGAEFPGLVHVSVLPFGAHGEHSGYTAQELNVLHAGGEGYLMPNGLALEMFPDRPPVKIYGHFAEFIGGASAVCATLAAAIVQPEAGGQFVDVSVQDANVAVGCFAVQRLGDGVLETRHTRSFKYGGVLECADGYAQILVLEERQWAGLVKLMGEPEWALRPELADPLERGRRGAEINRHLRGWARTQTVGDIVRNGQTLNVPVARYNEPADLLEAEQSRARNMFSKIALPGIGKLPMLTAPFQFPQQPLAITQCAHAPGEDNERVWCELLGHGTVDLQQWTREGVI